MNCKGCADGEGFPLAISMAFQPIVDVTIGKVFAHEALVRGAAGEGAGTILAAVSESSRYAFDQACRVKAIDMAADLGIADKGAALSINFLPNAVYEPRACIRATLGAAMRRGFPLGAIIFEFTEAEKLDVQHVLNILPAYKAMGFRTAIDDFGAGWSGLGLLSMFTPDIVKLDMELIRNIDSRPEARIIVANILNMLRELGVTPVCEGIETEGEYQVLRALGVNLMQGYFFAKPRFEGLAEVRLPGASLAA
jgi:EAL domain-containing protein (putative c-di-GMP-specific phosphodiesterase class I)